MNLLPATYKVLYNGKNITADITDHLMSIQYTDKVQGESDELELQLEDTDGLWQNAWYPEKGAKLSAEIEFNGTSLNFGNFTIDEVEFSGGRSGDTISIKAVAAGITKNLRTDHYAAHEKKTLREIANTIAASHGLTVQGTIPNVTFDRVTQYHQTDLNFLYRLAVNYGLVFNVRDKLLIFTSIYDLENKSGAITLDKSDLVSWSIKDKSAQVYKAVVVKYQDPADGDLKEAELADNETEGVEDELQVRGKVENKQQAEMTGKSRLHQANSTTIEGSFSTEGNPLLIAGNNVEMRGLGKLSGIFHITQSTHSIDRTGGYSTSFEAKRVGKIGDALHIPKKKAVARKVTQKYLFDKFPDTAKLAGIF